jgi:serine/threonine protein phosphatase PrpC
MASESLEQTLDSADDMLPFAATLQLVVGQSSEKGRKLQNEDAIGIRIPSGILLTSKGVVSVISDGVSTAEGGAHASAISVSNFLADYYSTPETWSVQTSSTKVLTALNRWLYGLGQDYRDARRGFVCTFSALVFKSCSVHMLHVGDSRIYRFRDGELLQLSHDHSTNINSSSQYLTRALGMDVKLDIDYKTLSVDVGDLYLLTTDGVHDRLTEFEIHKKLTIFSQQHQQLTDDTCEQFCQTLIKKAFDLGSKDNLSAQLLYVSQLPHQVIDDVYHSLSQRPFPPPLSVGMKLDGYQVTHIIHQSQRSQVYRVVNEQDHVFCMKTPSVNYIDDAAYIERFILESWTGQRINSTHVVKVVEQHKTKSALYYLTEFLSGISLAEWLTQYKKAPVEDVLQLLKQIELGVRAFHRRETLHQDLKPDNIFITGDGVVKIIDFGSCYIKGIAEISSPLTRETILGTADYTAPEVVLGYQADSRADLFSLAVIAFEMLAGQLPFKGKLEKCRNRQDFLRLDYVSVYQLNPMVPEWIDIALKKALNIEPNLRQADTCELIYQLTTSKSHKRPTDFAPLITRNPVLFWQVISILLFIALMISLLK